MVRLEQVLDSWKAIRADTATAVEEFPAGDFDYKPCGDVMTFGEIARHILIAGHGLTGLLLEGEEHLGGPTFREKMARFALLPEGAGAADLCRHRHAGRRRAGHAARVFAVCQGARTHPQGAAFLVYADEGNSARHHAPPVGEAGRSLTRQTLYNTVASVAHFR
jgi:hypothetical protein